MSFQRMNLESKSFKAIYRQNGKTWHIWPTSLLIGNITNNPSEEATTERWRLPTWFSKRSLLSYHVMTDTLDLLHLFMGLLRMYNVRSYTYPKESLKKTRIVQQYYYFVMSRGFSKSDHQDSAWWKWNDWFMSKKYWIVFLRMLFMIIRFINTIYFCEKHSKLKNR